MRLDHDIHELAAGQHSLIATWQLRAVGASNSEIDRLRLSNGWDPITPRVLARTGSGFTEDRRVMAAVLDASPGAAAAEGTAAALFGVPGYRVAPIIVDRHRGVSRRSSDLARVREVVDLMPHHVKLLRGIPVVSPARLVCELARTQHPGRVERNLDWLIREGMLSGGAFRKAVHELAGRGWKGSPLLRDLDAERGPGYEPHGSGTELRFKEILEREGQRPMRKQVNVSDGEEWTGRVDFVDPDLPLIVEVQSEKYHSLLLDCAADARRRRDLEAAGYTVLEVWDTDVYHRPRGVVAQIRAERATLAAERIRHS